jgi:hypothetical protein
VPTHGGGPLILGMSCPKAITRANHWHFYFIFHFSPMIPSTDLGKKKGRRGGRFENEMPTPAICRGQIPLDNVPSRYTEKFCCALQWINFPHHNSISCLRFQIRN